MCDVASCDKRPNSTRRRTFFSLVHEEADAIYHYTSTFKVAAGLKTLVPLDFVWCVCKRMFLVDAVEPSLVSICICYFHVNVMSCVIYCCTHATEAVGVFSSSFFKLDKLDGC